MPEVYYTAATVREMERRAIEETGIPAWTLMQRAGEAAWRFLCDTWPRNNGIVVFCGPGNNGGDGYVIAGLAAEAGHKVAVIETAGADRLSPESARARQFCLAAGNTPIHSSRPLPDINSPDIILVDALLGIGIKGDVRPPIDRLITLINGSPASVLAIDIPSGLNSDTGIPCRAAVKAACTITFIGHKAGLVLAEGPEYSGLALLDDLGLPDEIKRGLTGMTVHSGQG